MDKKSEKIEVRVSHAEKRTLRMRAAKKGLSVSAYIRHTLQLSRLEKSDTQYTRLARRHPRKIVGGLASMIAGFTIGTIVFPMATAQTHKVEIVGAFAGQSDQTPYRTAFEDRLSLGPDTPARLSIDVGNGIGLVYEIEVQLIPGEGATNILDLTIFETSHTAQRVVSRPRLAVVNGEAAKFSISRLEPDGTEFEEIVIETVLTPAN